MYYRLYELYKTKKIDENDLEYAVKVNWITDDQRKAIIMLSRRE